MALFLQTLRALAAPRRSVPIAVLAAALLAAQAWFSTDRVAVALAVSAVVGFLLFAPFLWRWWRPAVEDRGGSLAAGVALGSLSVLPFVLLVLTPGEARPAFLSMGLNGLVVGALFWVGGWGLARDIDLEEGLHRERRRVELLEREKAQAELLALKAQLDPHFLFNTLNAIAAWCQEDPAQAEAAILRLAGLLRELMAGVKVAEWPLGSELGLVRDVAALYAVRDPERFGLDWEVGDVPPVSVPPLLLLPVIENAFTHGPGRGARGRVRVRVTSDAEGVRVRIWNPGGFTGRRPGGQGIALVERRLALVGGAFAIGERDGGTEAVVALGAVA